MKKIYGLRHAAMGLAAALLAATLPAVSQSLPSAVAPLTPKALRLEVLKLPAEAAATEIRLTAPPATAVDEVKRANASAELKRLQVGLNREVGTIADADASALKWFAVDGGVAAHWSVTSAGAKALRIGLAAKRTTMGLQIRFSGDARPDTIYGPFSEADLAVAAGRTYWSPVLEGETATVELFVPEAAPGSVEISIAQVSHLFVNPAEPQAEAQLKAIGSSGFCEVNLVCRSAADVGLSAAGSGVARMSFSDGTGTFLCTGTVLNSAAGQFVPYFYTAAHCISDQATAATLTTWWFYESTSCGSNTLNPANQQVSGGATLVYADAPYDISFLRLNSQPPGGVTYVGWDAAPLSNGIPLTAIHHPVGDLKKISLGTFGGYVTNQAETGRTGNFIKSNWNSVSTGVTEGGSSGSGIFSNAGGRYDFRGGLLGGPSSCQATSSSLYDYYSRFDVAYQNAVSQYLQAAAATNYTALWWNAPANSESGWGINISQQGDIVFATLFTYDSSGNPMWLVMSAGARQGNGDSFSGPLYRTTGSPFNQSFVSANTKVTQVGTMTISFSGSNAGNVSYTVNGVAVSKNIEKQAFAATGAAQCTPTTSSRASAANYTDLWWSSPANGESGWGINLTQQGSIMFGTLFAYDTGGQGMWLVMSAGQRQSDGSFTGALYQTRENGGGFNAQPWPGVAVTQVGTMTLRFSNGENGTLTYTVNGSTVTKPITRQVFSTPVPICTG